MGFEPDAYELELVEGCLRNDRQTQQALYNKYKDAMYTILYRLNGPEEAADVLQDAFIEIFRSLKGFKKKSTLGAWIKTIVIRTGIARQKKTILFEDLRKVTEEEEALGWDENLTGTYLEKAILLLPVGYRSVFLLMEVEGYTHKEVSELLGISAGTSKSQLYHAKKMLQKHLKELMY